MQIIPLNLDSVLLLLHNLKLAYLYYYSTFIHCTNSDFPIG